MSGGGPSSTKRSPQCAARVPVPSRRCEDRVGAIFDLEVYGLLLQSGVVLLELCNAEKMGKGARKSLFFFS